MGWGCTSCPRSRRSIPLEQFTRIPNAHLPVAKLQHVPIGGCTHGFVGVHEAPCVHTTFVPMHCTMASVVQAPVSVLQHVPLGGIGQGFGLHSTPLVHTLSGGQLAALLTVQMPRFVQQLPCGGRHGFGGPQLRLAVQTFGAPQNDWKSTTHPPSDVQHVPVDGQGDAEQAWPEMNELGNVHVPAVPAGDKRA